MATASANLSLIIPEATDATVVRTVYNINWELIDDIFNTVSLTEFGYLDGVTSAIQTQLNAKQPLDTGLTSIAALTTAADKMIYTTALDTYAVASLTAFARTILADADEATFKATVNLEIGTDVQAYDASLTSISALTYVSGSFIALTAADTYAVRTYAQVKSDLSLNAVENTALSTWVGTTNITTLGTIATGVWSGTVIGAAKGGTGVANNAASTLTISGNFATALTVTEATGVTLPASGTLATTAQLHTQNTDTDLDATFEATFGKHTDKLSAFAATTSAELAGVISDETGSGALVFGNTPTLITPVLGAASATSLALTSQSGCKVYRATTNQTIANATATKIQFNAESYDVLGEYDPTTNYRFTATTAGYYLVASAINYVTFPADKKIQIYIMKNGAIIAVNEIESSIIDYISAFILSIVQLSVTDYLEIGTAHWAGVANDIRLGEGYTFLSIAKLY